MSKKLFISLAPLVVVAAFAVMPVAAQAAAPHFYSAGTEIKPGTVVPVVSWGGKTNLSQTSNIGEINCRGVGGGTLENPVGGGAGEGISRESTFFECKSEKCEKAATEDGIPLTPYATTNEGTNALEGKPLAWKNILTGGPGATEISETIGEPFSGTFGKPTAGEIVADVNCETPPGFEPHIVGVAAKFEGELNPKMKNGAKEGSKPSEAVFSGAPTGALHSEVGGEGTNSGSVKFEGYNLQELITVEG